MQSTRVRGAVDVDTYMAASVTFSATAAATVIWEIDNPVAVAAPLQKLVRVQRIWFSATQTTQGNVGDYRLEKRNGVATGGTSASMTAVPLDSGQKAATAANQNFTSNPTPGTLVGILWQPRVIVPATTTQVSPLVFDFNFAEFLNGRPITLRAGEALVLNLGGGALPAGFGNCQISVLWTEEKL